MRKSEGQKIPEKEIVKEKPASTIAYEVLEFINLKITKHVGKVKDEELTLRLIIFKLCAF